MGIEVATNTNISNILISKYAITMEKAARGISAFFVGETISRLTGAIILNWIKLRVFLLITALISLVGVAGVFVSPIASVLFIGVCLLYILWVSFYVRKN